MSVGSLQQSQAADYVLLIGEPESCRTGRALLKRAVPHIIAHTEDSPSRAVQLLGCMSYRAVVVWWWRALTLERLAATGVAAAPARRLVFTDGAPHDLIAGIGSLGTGWTASEAREAPGTAQELIALLGQCKTRQRGVPLFRCRHSCHIDLRPVAGALARNATQPLTKCEVVVLTTRLARMSFSEREEAMQCKRRFIEKYEKSLRCKLGIQEADAWMVSGLDMLAREGRLREAGLGRNEDPRRG